MNREEILEAATGLSFDEIEEADRYHVITDDPETGSRDIWAILGVDTRRVIVRDSHPVGPDVASVATTVPIAAFMHLYTVEEHQGEGHAATLIETALSEAATHALTKYAAMFATPDDAEFLIGVGFWHPAGSPEGFMVYELTDEPWPPGSVNTRGRW